MKKIIILFYTTIIINLGFSDELKSFMIYGSDHMVTVQLPDSWMIDMGVANQYNINGFFYINEYDVYNSPVNIVCTLEYRDDNRNNIDTLSILDLEKFIQDYPDLKYNEIKLDINNENNYEFKVYLVTSEENENIKQYCAYIDGGLTYMIIIYLTLTDANNQKGYIDDFGICLNNIIMSNINLLE